MRRATLSLSLQAGAAWLRTPIVRDGPNAAVGAAEATWKLFAEAVLELPDAGDLLQVRAVLRLRACRDSNPKPSDP